MAEQLIIMDPTEEVFSKCLDGIASGLITVMSRADFPGRTRTAVRATIPRGAVATARAAAPP